MQQIHQMSNNMQKNEPSEMEMRRRQLLQQQAEFDQQISQVLKQEVVWLHSSHDHPLFTDVMWLFLLAVFLVSFAKAVTKLAFKMTLMLLPRLLIEYAYVWR